ncbi:hemolysin III family protein [Mangrovimicrobium sediminis]|uniref:Hemolysin III family protein n=1 Tax=Mangrovimicrobium sediminis TaxID=2562682 RepID=A0A4Z0M4Z6_9GAMM|nr:hemolysin III family protein [Haliea sp. SAOS-164]TGD74579.1 hemolysin III family protein [Haliea sp. SAOS-164]
MYYGERFNSISHVVGAALALIGLGALLYKGFLSGDWRATVGYTVYGLSMVMMYTMSALYHSFPMPRVKRIFQQLDHVSIYLLIAGTYTPYMIVSLGHAQGPWMLAAIWGLAVVGICLDLFMRKRIHGLQIAIYLGMGWLGVLVFRSFSAALETAGMAWLLAGGIAYTVGVVFYVLDKMNRLDHAHGIWHLFVLCGSLAHFVSILGYVD